LKQLRVLSEQQEAMTCHDHIFIVIAMTTSEMANVSVVFSGHFSWICEKYGQFSRFFLRPEKNRAGRFKAFGEEVGGIFSIQP
jgi:hypothetical protein